MLYPSNNDKIRDEVDKLFMLHDALRIWEHALDASDDDIASSKAIQQISRNNHPNATKMKELLSASKPVTGVDAMLDAYASGVCVEDIIA